MLIKSGSHHAASFVFTIALIIALSNSAAFAQAPPREKPRLKDFGSSVRKLKWDPERKVAIPIRQGNSAGEKDDVIRIETSLVVCEVSVLDPKGNAVQGLTQEDFAVTEDNKAQQVGAFSLGDNSNIPRSIVLLIDYSGSQFPYINTSIQAAKTR